MPRQPNVLGVETDLCWRLRREQVSVDQAVWWFVVGRDRLYPTFSLFGVRDAVSYTSVERYIVLCRGIGLSAGDPSIETSVL